ncbi:hypothetical protein F5Y04DRAFT_93707 [Hypomontagnella monticulosa]|nr:hypothetical protein F5Y04DRAFT_93707 [Hypomontagnella monticulosa]
MASSEASQNRELLVLASNMKAIPQTPGPNGSRVVKKRSMPRLGDGLCDVFLDLTDSAPHAENTCVSPSDAVVSSSASTASGRSSTTAFSAPDSDAKAFDVDWHLPFDKRADTPSPGQDGLRQASPIIDTLSSTQHTSNISNLESQLPQLFPLASINSPTSPSPSGFQHAKQIRDTSTSLSTATSSYEVLSGMLKQSATGYAPEGTPINAPGVQKLLEWIHSGSISLGEAKNIARRCKDWRLVKALTAHGTVGKQCVAEPDVDPMQQPDDSPASIPLIEKIRDRFLLKLVNYSSTDAVDKTQQAEANVHVFVDMSNIFIGFLDAYKTSQNIPLQKQIKPPPFSFKAFTLVIERGRKVQKKILAGSVRGESPEDPRKYWPPYFFEADQLGYQMNIFGRIQRPMITPAKSKRRGGTPSRATFPRHHEGSDGDTTGATYEVRNSEQGVDENLHLNMMNSMWDHISSPGTMVLATGDAAEAEFSRGFLHYATLALDKGWKIELVTWKRSVSTAWTDSKFADKYGHRFKIIFLDSFLEEIYSENIL